MNISQRLRACAKHTGLDAVIELLQEAADEIDALQARAQATQAEVTDVVVGCLPTMNQDPYPALGDWWVQLWDGPSDAAMVIARVYGASPAEANEKAETIARAILALRPEPVPMTDEQVDSFRVDGRLHWLGKRQLIRAVEAYYGITTKAKKEGA